MSRFLSRRYEDLVPYTPGEQPVEKVYVKLNTNESPYPPSHKAVEEARKELSRLQLYSDPTAGKLNRKFAELIGVEETEVMATNGSDEILNFAFMAFCDADHPAVFPDITYGFYPVFANLHGIPSTIVPLLEDFSVDVEGLCKAKGTVFLANPNAPTGKAIPVWEVEKILLAHTENVVVVDEAYVDFGAVSCVPLIHRYPNLLVTQTFSKSRSMAGARLGFGIGCKDLIADLQTIRNSTNPYNVNRMTMAAGIGAIEDEAYTRENCSTIMETREFCVKAFLKMGFDVIPSQTNFLFVKHPKISGKDYYLRLREEGILVRHFDGPRVSDYNRITIGNPVEMKRLINATRTITEDII